MVNRVLHLLEYPKILNQLSKHTASSLGKEKVAQLTPVFDIEHVTQAQQATCEGLHVLRLKGNIPFGGISDIRPAVKRSVIGGMLSARELIAIAHLLSAGRKLKLFFKPLFDIEDHDFSMLQAVEIQIDSLQDVEREIISCIDDDGYVVDAASPELRKIRAKIRGAVNRVKQQLEQITKSATKQKMLQDPLVTVRNGRYCLPVKAEYRTQFGGMVHDQSSSGATLFMEPNAVVDANNERQEAKLKEEREVEKILHQLTALVAEYEHPLIVNVEALAELDFIFAKAHLAKTMKATQPKLNEHGYFQLKKARHPLISEDEIVPVSFELGDPYTAMLITGPNTGGKTVTLKTLGLLTLMTCSGLFIPADENSEMAVVSSVYADIGDEQSIEQSLSTFSSHMSHIVQILAHMDAGSLILLDELGAGTDPTEGAALAMSILDDMHAKGTRIVATTHYSELKAYAYTKEGVINASVEFDVQTLRPTYRLLVGVPGRSNAFSIAKRLGLAEDLIAHAQGKMGSDETRVETMISSLEDNQKQAEQEREKARQIRVQAEQIRAEVDQKESSFETKKEDIMRQAEAEAQAYLDKVKQEAEAIMAELRDHQSGQQVVKDHLLIEAKKKLEQLDAPEQRQSHKTKTKKQGVHLQAGDDVYVHTFRQKGHVVEKVSNQEYLVQLGIMKMKVNMAHMEKIKREEPTKRSTTTVNTKQETTKLELDLRGQNIDEAVMNIDKYIDDALLANYHQVSLIHGKGTGQLRKGVQEYLKKHTRVENTRLGGSGEGGNGVTVITLN